MLSLSYEEPKNLSSSPRFYIKEQVYHVCTIGVQKCVVRAELKNKLAENGSMANRGCCGLPCKLATFFFAFCENSSSKISDIIRFAFFVPRNS